jgi:glyoxylase-like metal-dependent hydrolase (beta-lactamase superfamily II)
MTADAGISTAHAISPDSGKPWAIEGAWRIDERTLRIPLPLPLDGLRAVNVYVLEGEDGLTLVDGGWAVTEGREALERSLATVGYSLGDVVRFLVTHAHRDHLTLATAISNEHGAEVYLGEGERPILDLLQDTKSSAQECFVKALEAAGADRLARAWAAEGDPPRDCRHWRYPTAWITGDQEIEAGGALLTAVHTPGHTPGHYVFADLADHKLFSGDHVLPTITPSIGFATPIPRDPLGDFLRSLARVRALPDMQLLPAHGPVTASSHARVDALLRHHETRLGECLDAMANDECNAAVVAARLAWTRRARPFSDLDTYNQGMAVMETSAHLEVLVARGLLVARHSDDGVTFAQP